MQIALYPSILLRMVLVIVMAFAPIDGALGQQPDAVGAESPDPSELSGEQTAGADAPIVEITDRGTVELHVADMPLSTVLRLLSLQGQRNIIASPSVKGTVTASLYGVSFEEALASILIPNDAAFRQVGKFIYIYTNKELEAMASGASDQPITRVIRLSYLSAQDARNYIRPLMGDKDVAVESPPGASGLESEASDGGGNSNAVGDFLIVTAPPRRMKEIEDLLRQLDVRPQQVLVEATILRAELTNDNSLGVDFTLVGGVDLELLGATSNALSSVTLGNLPQHRFERFNAAATSDFVGNVPSGGVTLGILKDQVAIFVRALEQITDTTVVANPKVLTLNRQKGQVIVGRRDGYLTTTVTETQAVQSVEFLETGTQLIFRPFIGGDGYIRVELRPKDSVGFISAQGLPTEQTTEVTTNVLIRDGETILIGGLFREVTNDARSQIPWFGSLPWIGTLFRSRNDSTTREEVIILLTLHVVKDHERYAQASRAQFEDIETSRVGLREGMMWQGRERLAQWHYRKALDALACEDRKNALWHVRMTLHNNPRFMPALQLRESLLGERAWEEDGTVGRAFLHEMIARERGYELRFFGRPVPHIGPKAEDAPSGPEGGLTPENGN